MKTSQHPFFFRPILTSLTMCAALCFSGVSSFGDTFIMDLVRPLDGSWHLGSFGSDLDSDFLLNHGNPGHGAWSHQGYLRSFAEQSQTDDGGSPNHPLTSNVSGLASRTPDNPTGTSDESVSEPKMSVESFAPRADPPVPEPATLALFGSGLCGIALVMRRKARKHR